MERERFDNGNNPEISKVLVQFETNCLKQSTRSELSGAERQKGASAVRMVVDNWHPGFGAIPISGRLF